MLESFGVGPPSTSKMEENEPLEETNGPPEQLLSVIVPCNKKDLQKQKDIVVVVKEKKRTGKCVGRPPAPPPPPPKTPFPTDETHAAYNDLSPDMWFQISRYIHPEDVQSFALICRRTAAIVNTRQFWLHLYMRFCADGGRFKWITTLDADSQPHCVKKASKKAMRQLVIKSLFQCYPQLKMHAKYSIDSLLGKYFVHFRALPNGLGCYKFVSKPRCGRRDKTLSVSRATVEDWECLAAVDSDDEDEAEEQVQSLAEYNPHEGSALLVVGTSGYNPMSTELLQLSNEQPVFLAAARNLLQQDMRLTTLEMDFMERNGKTKNTIKNIGVRTYLVVPWWDPNFLGFMSESDDLCASANAFAIHF